MLSMVVFTTLRAESSSRSFVVSGRVAAWSGDQNPRVFGDRPVALMRATPGRGGTILSQAAWLPVLRTLGTRAWFGPRLTVCGASKVFDASGALVDDQVRTQLRDFMAGFARFIQAER